MQNRDFESVAQAVDRVASEEDLSTRIQLALMMQLSKDGAAMSREEGKADETYICPLLLAAGVALIREAIDTADGLPSVLPDNVDFDTQCALRQVLKDQVVTMVREVLEEATV